MARCALYRFLSRLLGRRVAAVYQTWAKVPEKREDKARSQRQGILAAGKQAGRAEDKQKWRVVFQLSSKNKAEKESSYPKAFRKKKNRSVNDGSACRSSSTRGGTGGREEHAGGRQKVYLPFALPSHRLGPWQSLVLS